MQASSADAANSARTREPANTPSFNFPRGQSQVPHTHVYTVWAARLPSLHRVAVGSVQLKGWAALAAFRAQFLVARARVG